MPVGRGVLQSEARISAGQRDKWVTIQTKADSVSADGFPADATWSDLITIFMSRHDVRADERAAAGMDSAYTETVWDSAYDARLDPEVVDVPSTKRLVYRGRVYNIRSASLLERRAGIEYVTLAQVG